MHERDKWPKFVRIVVIYHFNIHASGVTIQEAIAAFKRVLSGYLDVLSEEEETLDLYLREQLAYLRSLIKAD